MNQNISYSSPDVAYKAKYVDMIKQACIEFNMLPIEYNHNKFDHYYVLDLIE